MNGLWLCLGPFWLLCFALLHPLLAQQKNCPVRIFSNRLLDSERTSPNGAIEKTRKLWSQFDTENRQLGQVGSTETPWPNNSALLFSEHYEPDSESSLTANYKCQFIFVGAIDERVQIIFHQFRLKQTLPRRRQNMTSLRCEENDHLSAHVLLNDRMSKVQDFCGQELPAQLMSAKNVITLTYVLKSALMAPLRRPQPPAHWWARGRSEEESEEQHFGWIAEYRFIRALGAQPPEAIPRGVNGSCAFLFNGTLKATGNVWSPNYPGFYPRNIDCQYEFIGGTNQVVYITFEYFDVEGFGHCEESTQSDFVLFSNYKTRDKTNRRFCGSLRPKGAVQSESNYFRMRFRTNEIFDGTGFYARYQFHNEGRTKSRMKLAPSNGEAGEEEGSRCRAIWTIIPTICIMLLF